ncbi:universal stress protein [Roseinatronobacter sp. NSM]|uniref:universal stress protein n=1 Tax=Roseinatronobacter sp. NSM TaxID=3457785 RepID=UPI0040355325
MAMKILLPIDMSQPASWVKPMGEAQKMLRDGGELHIVSVLPDFGLSMVGAFFQKGFEQAALLQFTEAMRKWVRANVPGSIDVHPHVLHGNIYDEILRAADKLDVDVIIMAAHRPEARDYLLGPNAARVVRHAKQSVYVVRD